MSDLIGEPTQEVCQLLESYSLFLGCQGEPGYPYPTPGKGWNEEGIAISVGRVSLHEEMLTCQELYLSVEWGKLQILSG